MATYSMLFQIPFQLEGFKMKKSTWSLLIFMVGIIGWASAYDYYDKIDISILRDRLEFVERKLARLEKALKLDDNDDSAALSKAGGLSANQRVIQVPRSCLEALTSNPDMISGTYFIDPDGSDVGEGPIEVYCNITTGSTSISHDSEAKSWTSDCEQPGCYSKEVTYTAPMKQIKALMEISKECHQLMKYDCLEAPLEYQTTQYSYWIDADGAPQYFWAGEKIGNQHICQCGINKTCTIGGTIYPDLPCNCDYNSAVPTADTGFLADKKILPVTALYFGQHKVKGSSSWHTLGKLECSGKQVVYNIPRSCYELSLIGHSLNGIYYVMGGEGKKIETVYCDFNLGPDDEGFEKRLGFVPIKSSETGVSFYVQRSSNFDNENSRIPFEIAISNNGEAMDITSGVFTAPNGGRYFFSFSGVKEDRFGYKEANKHMAVSFRLNGEPLGYAAGAIYDKPAPAKCRGIKSCAQRAKYFSLPQEKAKALNFFNEYDYTFSLQATLDLKTGDTVDLFLHRGAIKGNSFNHFNGFLLDEDLESF